MANSWGESGTTWGQGDWGNQNNYTLTLTGLSMTGSVGELVSAAEQGWGRDTWGSEPWGDSYSPVVAVTGLPMTGALGTLAYAQAEDGWGRDEWGTGNWGQNTTTVIPTGIAATGSLGTLTTTQLSIVTLTGIEATASLGTPTISRLDMIFDITGPAAMSAGLGVPNINNGADHSQGVGSLLATGSVGSLSHEMTYGLTGIEGTLSLGTAVATNTELIDVTGIEATGSLGSLTVADMAIGLTGLAGTMSLGTTTVTDMAIGISGFEMSGSLGSGGVSPLHYKNVDITGNTSYTYVEHSA